MSVATPLFFPELQASPFASEQALFDCLCAYQTQLPSHTTQLLSLSQAIAPVDPLHLFQSLGLQHQVHFFCENRPQKDIRLAFGICRSLRISGKYRFRLAQQFAQDCFARLHPLVKPPSQSIESNIFCGFSFFETPSASASFPNTFLFLPEFQITQSRGHWGLTCHIALNTTTHLRSLTARLFKVAKQIRNCPVFLPSALTHAVPDPIHLPQPDAFARQIDQSLQQIQQCQLSKVVLAAAVDLIPDHDISVGHSLQQLRQFYGDCQLFSLGNGEGDCFVGASPERLLSLRGGQLTTDALAGSAPRDPHPTRDWELGQTLLQNNKERREHQAVLDYIVGRLQCLGMVPQNASLKLLKLSNIQHLWTAIHANCPAHLHPLELVAHLHPTPAVAGVPTAIACGVIREKEAFERELYAAPLGWLDNKGDSEFIVGIRSALISPHRARLYAGAGIVEGSNTQKEVAEIKLKLQTLWRVLR